MEVTDEQRAAARRATERARQVLAPGDRLYIEGCGDYRATVTFAGFCEGMDWIKSKGGKDDIHAHHILRVNGRPVNFKDAPPADTTGVC